LLFAGGLSRRERLERVGLFVGLVAVVVLPCYVAMMVAVFGVHDT
jgi:hypothetical protein